MRARRFIGAAAMTMVTSAACSLGSLDGFSDGTLSAPDGGEAGLGNDGRAEPRDASGAETSTSDAAKHTYGTPTAIAPLVTNPRGLAARPSSEEIFWTNYDSNGDGVIRRRKADGTLETFRDALPMPGAIAVDETNVYWSSDEPQYQNIDRSPITGSPIIAHVAQTGGSPPVSLAVDDTLIYWIHATYDCVEACAKTLDNQTSVCASMPAAPSAFAVETSSHIAAASVEDTGVFYSVVTAFSDVTQFSDAQRPQPRAIAVKDGVIYWATVDGDIFRGTPGNSASKQAIAHGQIGVGGIVADGERLYWTIRGKITTSTVPPDGEVRSCTLAGEDLGTVATGQFQPGPIVLTPTNVVWINAGEADKATGAVMRATK